MRNKRLDELFEADVLSDTDLLPVKQGTNPLRKLTLKKLLEYIGLGPKGDKGDKGDPGEEGIKGPIGLTGPQGDKGDRGDTGAQGPVGLTGQPGIQGLPGPQGQKGDKGDTGLQGIKGDTGATGAQGATGPMPTNADQLTEGSTNLFFLASRVLGVVLTGISFVTNSPIVAADTILIALGKLQAQITALTNSLSGKVDKSDASQFTGGTLNDARLSTNIAFLSGSQTISGSKTFNGATTFNNASNMFNGVISAYGDILGNNTSNTVMNGVALDIHPEVGSPSFLPYVTNDIAYLTKRGGTCTISGTTQTINPDLLFDASPSYCTMDITQINGTTGLIIETMFGETFQYGTRVGVGFGQSVWRARSIKVEIYRASTAAWEVIANVTNYTKTIYSIAVPNMDGTGITGMRFTFNDFAGSAFPTSGFRVGQLFLYNYAGTLLKKGYVGRDGGDIYASLRINAKSAFGAFLTPSASVHLAPSLSNQAPLRFHDSGNVAPTTPNNGDIWFDGANLKMRIGGVTKTFTLT